VYPALAVLEALRSGLEDKAGAGSPGLTHTRSLEVLWVGSSSGLEAELIEREGITFEAIPSAGVHGVGWKALPGNLWEILKGVFAAKKILNRFRPDVIFYTGGYLAIPVGIASRLFSPGAGRPKNLAFVPDIEPGLALKVLARLADRIAVTTEASMKYIPSEKKLTLTGYPVRKSLVSWELRTAMRALNLVENLPTLLVFGGSKGARSINQATFEILKALLRDMQVIHITGYLDWPEAERIKSTLGGELLERYHAFPYLHEEMGAALLAADLVVSRAGASILGEFPLFGKPAILVPYPYAWRYQEVNARYLAARGAAVVLEDGELRDRLLSVIQKIIADKDLLDQMRRAMSVLARPEAASSIASLVFSLESSAG